MAVRLTYHHIDDTPVHTLALKRRFNASNTKLLSNKIYKCFLLIKQRVIAIENNYFLSIIRIYRTKRWYLLPKYIKQMQLIARFWSLSVWKYVRNQSLSAITGFHFARHVYPDLSVKSSVMRRTRSQSWVNPRTKLFYGQRYSCYDFILKQTRNRFLICAPILSSSVVQLYFDRRQSKPLTDSQPFVKFIRLWRNTELNRFGKF